MQLRQLIQPGITASVLAHGLLLGLVVLFSDVHPFGIVTAQPITVDLVKPEEVPKPSDETPSDNETPQLQIPKDVTAPAQQAASPPQSTPPSSSPPAAEPAKPQQRTAPADRQAAAGPQPQPARAQAAQQPASSTPPSAMPLAAQQPPAYTPPEPDVTVKYGVMLGLPEALPPPPSGDKDKPGDGTDATASSAASISSSLIAKFREHLKSCAKLPASVSRSDNVFVRLRVAMTPRATLAAEPALIEGTASAKALDLKSSAVRALSACQPYDMLPADRYGEWKVLDLSFTPQDFS
jgi:outer membrane biosynthesis protein TonB